MHTFASLLLMLAHNLLANSLWCCLSTLFTHACPQPQMQYTLSLPYVSSLQPGGLQYVMPHCFHLHCCVPFMH